MWNLKLKLNFLSFFIKISLTTSLTSSFLYRLTETTTTITLRSLPPSQRHQQQYYYKTSALNHQLCYFSSIHQFISFSTILKFSPYKNKITAKNKIMTVITNFFHHKSHLKRCFTRLLAVWIFHHYISKCSCWIFTIPPKIIVVKARNWNNNWEKNQRYR